MHAIYLLGVSPQIEEVGVLDTHAFEFLGGYHSLSQILTKDICPASQFQTHSRFDPMEIFKL